MSELLPGAWRTDMSIYLLAQTPELQEILAENKTCQ